MQEIASVAEAVKLLGSKVYTTGQVSKICKVAPRTVSKWFDAGKLRGYRIPGSEDRRVPREDLLTFLKDHGMPIPAGLYDDPAVYAVSCSVFGLATITSTELGIRAAGMSVSAAVIGCGDGLDAAVAAARTIRKHADRVHLALLLDDDRTAGMVSPADGELFDFVGGGGVELVRLLVEMSLGVTPDAPDIVTGVVKPRFPYWKRVAALRAAEKLAAMKAAANGGA